MAILYAMKWPIFVRLLRDVEGWTSAKDFDDEPGVFVGYANGL